MLSLSYLASSTGNSKILKLYQMGFLWRCIEEGRGRLEMRGGGKEKEE